MLDQVILVGRIVELKQNYDEFIITLEIPRYYKNSEGVYETDKIPCNVGKMLNDPVPISIGDTIGVKGTIICQNDNIEIVAKKVTYLKRSEQ